MRVILLIFFNIISRIRIIDPCCFIFVYVYWLCLGIAKLPAFVEIRPTAKVFLGKRQLYWLLQHLGCYPFTDSRMYAFGFIYNHLLDN